MMRRVYIVGVLLFIFSLNAYAQDRPSSAEELFYCYPADTYDMISFTSVELPENEEAYRFYRWMMRQLRQAQEKAFNSDFSKNQSKTSLFDGMRYSTHATISRSRFVQFDSPREFSIDDRQKMMEELRKEYKTSLPIETFDREKRKTVVHGVWTNERSTLKVHYLDDVQAAVKAALEEGSIAETGEVRHDRPIYSYSQKLGTVSVDFLFWATDTGELLMAERADDLDAMISTVHDGRASILSQREYVDAFEMIPDLGHSWSIRFDISNRGLREKQLEYTTDERMKKMWNDSINSGAICRIHSRSIGDTYTTTSIELYENMDIAAEAFERKKQLPDRYRQMLNRPNMDNMAKESLEMQIYRAEHTEYKQDGAAVISVMTYDRELVKKMKGQYEVYAKQWREQEDQKKKEQKTRKQK